jgi:hypothetical protein
VRGYQSHHLRQPASSSVEVMVRTELLFAIISQHEPYLHADPPPGETHRTWILRGPSLCSACEEISEVDYDLKKCEARPINHTKQTFIASIKYGCRLCKVIRHSLFGWVSVRHSDRTARDSGKIDIANDFQQRYSLTTALEYGESNESE